MATTSKGHFVYIPPQSKKRNKNALNWQNEELWYRSYTNIWNSFESKLKKISEEISMKLINDVVQFVFDYEFTDEFIPVATIFTGINLSDHDNLFSIILTEMQNKVNGHVVFLQPFQSMKLKYIIECVVSGFINGNNQILADGETDLENINMGRKVQYSLSNLHDWYKNSLKSKSINSDSLKLIIVIPDMESFPNTILQQFLLALSVYKERMPFVIILGVATSLNILHSSFSVDVLSKFSLHLFQSQSSTIFLNTVLEKVFLTSDCPFQISGKIFALLTEIFLNYNFSVEEFIRGIKFCLMNHYIISKVNILLCSYEEISNITKTLSENQRTEVSILPSIIKYKKKEQLPDDEILETKLIEKLLKELHEHLSVFHVVVRCIHAFTKSLPGSPLGTHVREIYIEAMDSDICRTETFKKCFILLQHLSKDEILEKLEITINILKSSENYRFYEIIQKLSNFHETLEKSDLCRIVESPIKSPRKRSVAVSTSRSEFKQKLLININQEKKLSEFEVKKNEFFAFLSEEFFKPFLKSPSNFPLNEVMIFNRLDIIKQNFEAVPRASLHHAMFNPYRYLKCKCCKSTKNETLKSFPDICIAYKLHLECGTRINLYDWLQSFSYIVDEDNRDNEEINPQVHARFLQAVKELQFLGFVVSSKHNPDFVKRMIL